MLMFVWGGNMLMFSWTVSILGAKLKGLIYNPSECKYLVMLYLNSSLKLCTKK